MSDLGLPAAEEAAAPRVGLVRLLLGLVGLAAAVAALWSVLAWGVSMLGSSSGPTGTDCAGEPVESLESLFGVQLPDGTTVRECRYLDAQDWQLTASFLIPATSINLPPEWDATGADAEGIHRSAELEVEGDSATLALTMFSE
jgi:hypothetical protein